MDHRQILLDVARVLNERGQNYDDGVETSFPRAASLATLKLNREVSTYEVAVILESVKDARRAIEPEALDNHIDGIAYRAFAAEFSQEFSEKENVSRIRKAANAVSDQTDPSPRKP
jgi:hypothetical protein